MHKALFGVEQPQLLAVYLQPVAGVPVSLGPPGVSPRASSKGRECRRTFKYVQACHTFKAIPSFHAQAGG